MGGEVQGFVDDVIEHLVCVVLVVRREAVKHLVQQSAESVNIHHMVVPVFLNHFGAHVPKKL